MKTHVQPIDHSTTNSFISYNSNRNDDNDKNTNDTRKSHKKYMFKSFSPGARGRRPALGLVAAEVPAAPGMFNLV